MANTTHLEVDSGNNRVVGDGHLNRITAMQEVQQSLLENRWITSPIDMAFICAQDVIAYLCPLQIGRNHVLKAFAGALLLSSGLAIAVAPALALQVVVTQVDKNTDGSVTYHFAVKMDQGETLTPGASRATADFVTIYNFYGLVDGTAKSPSGWEFSSEEFGRTPTSNGYPMVLPLDVPNTPNLTWTVTKPVGTGSQIDGFTATTHVSEVVQGEYSAQVTRQLPAVLGAAAGMPAALAKSSKQALIGSLPTPGFLANVK